MTGASRGIGLAIATALAEDGYDLTLVARTPERLQAAAAELESHGNGVLPVAVNLSKEEGVAAAAAAHRERFGRLDVLVNNAGLGIYGPIEGYETKHLDLQLALDLRAPILFYREALDLLRIAAAEHRNAVVINMSSIAGKRGAPGLSVYSAAKHGIVGFTEAMNAELSGEGIKSCVLCPAFVDTDLADYSQNPVPPEEMIRPSDIAESVRSLLRLSPQCVVPELMMVQRGPEAVAS